MSAIFSDLPGQGKDLGVNAGGTTGAALISVGGMTKSTAVLYTGVGFNARANVQYMHTLKQKIYVYAFGNRMGELSVSGLALWNPCDTTLSSGIVGVLSYFSTNSVGTVNTLVTVTLGLTAKTYSSIQGYVDGVSTSFVDADRGLLGFRWMFSTMPALWSSTTP